MAGNRAITVTLRANVQDFKAQFDAASKAADSTAKSTEDSAKKSESAMSRLGKTAQENEKSWTRAGATLTGFGAAALGGLGVAVKAAMDWESAWAGVQKTVDGTAPQMAALEAGLRGLARELPASHQEIAAVAEAAGQLGIATPNVLGFTRTMINMGESTNMSAEEAATSLARFVNVMGTSQTDVGRLGASVVGLGNNFATTESEIVQMSQRLAGAGAQAGMTEGDVMGMAAAMSSVGIEAEAGGSAMSQTMKRIGKAVDEGGERLDLFAQVSGMSAEQFSAAWKTDPASAMDAFINGLSGVESQGMTTNGVLTELGITGIRESDALLRLSAASGQGADGMSLLAEAVQMGNTEFDRGTALIEEASKRYETAESRIQIAKNALVDMGISIGGTVLPAMANLADGAADVAGWFADLPAPAHEAAAGFTAVVGTGALAAGTFLMLAPRVADTYDAFKRLNSSTNGVAGKVGKIGLAVGVAAAAMPLLISGANAARDALLDIDRAALDVGMAEMTSRTLGAADAADAYDSILGDLADSGAINTKQFSDLGGAISTVADMDAIGKFGVSAGFAAGGLDLVIDRFTATGEALAVLYQTDLPAAQASFEGIWAKAEEGGATFDQLLEVMPAFKDELQAMANMMGEDATDSAVLLKIATGELSPVLDDTTGEIIGVEDASGAMAEGLAAVEGEAESATEALENMLGSLIEARNAFMDSELGALDYADALDEASEAIKENGKHWEDGTEAAAENKRELIDLAQQALKTADSFAVDNESGTFLQQAREDLIEVATELMGSKEKAEAYVDQLLGTPDEIQTIVDLETQAAKDEWRDLWDELGYNPPEVPVSADTTLAEGEVDLFTGLVTDGPPADVNVGADTTGAEDDVHIFGSQVGDVQTSPMKVMADITPAQSEVDALEEAVDNSGGVITVNGDTVPAGFALSTIMGIINNSDGTVTIDGQTYPADQALAAAIDYINRSGGTVEIDGNNDPANSKTDAAKRKADGTTGTIDVDANTASAESKTNHTARDRSTSITASAATGAAESALQRLTRGRTTTVTVRTTGNVSALTAGRTRAVSAYATGGPVHGPGTGTSDSVPALLSSGEHVITAKEVSLAGGHDAVSQIRAAIRGGHRFAEGGPVGESTVPVHYSPASQQMGQRVSASVDPGAIATAVASAVAGYQPIVQIGDRDFVGVMRRAERMGQR